jgi:hypothetical protein
MIVFDFHEQRALAEQIAADLTGAHPDCWDVVLPPGFGADRFAEQIRSSLATRPSRPRVAVLGADGRHSSVADFIGHLHWQWLECPAPPPALHRKDTYYLDLLFNRLRADERRLVLILTRFHRVLDYLKPWVLNRLREEEQAHRLHSVVLTPLPLRDLKKWWEADGHYFCNSEYGNQRHCTRRVLPPTEAEVTEACSGFDIPPGVAAFAQALTGGYPEPTAEVLRSWVKADRPELKPGVRRQLECTAREQLREFVDKLDPPRSSTYRDHVIDLYHRADPDDARAGLNGHPWQELILDADGLRAEALGAAAVEAAVRAGEAEGRGRSVWYRAGDRARLLYRRRQYEAAARVLSGLDTDSIRAHDQLLRGHAVVMQFLGGTEDEFLGSESSANRVLSELSACRESLTAGVPGLDPADGEKILYRYEELEKVATATAAAAKSQGRFAGRVVDVLAGFSERERRNDRAALLLLLSRLESARTMAGDTAALAYALPLPEQVMRVWALWAAGVNYYSVPPAEDPTWAIVRENWPLAQYGPPDLPEPGEDFRSLPLLSAFALARWIRLPDSEKTPSPESDFRSLFSQLTRYEMARNRGAHGVCWPGRKQRAEYIELISRWLTAAIAASPDKRSRSELLAIIEPLPVVLSSGQVEW